MIKLSHDRLARAGLAAVAFLTLGAWKVGPNFHQPPAPVSGAWMGGQPGPAVSPDAWWASFDDPELTRVVARALAQNTDIQQAAARVLQARAQAKASGAAMMPQADATGSLSQTTMSLQSPIGSLVRNIPGFERRYADYQLGAQASWEIDLFGGLQREHEAAGAQLKASEAELAAVRVAVAAETADAYLQARAFQARLAVTRNQESVQEDLVALVKRRAGQGVASDREVHQAQALLEGVQASEPPLIAGLEAQFNRLDILMGAQPGTWRAELATVEPIPAAPSVTDAAGPAGLLRRRPDVVAAEQRLIAANANIGAALSNYYPKVSISGLFGLDSMSASQLFTGSAVASQVGAGLRWRLFDFGRVDAEVIQARGRYAESLAAWRGTVLRGAGEVETAFSDLAQRQARAKVLARQIDDLTDARRQAQQAYEAGVISLIEVRDADRDLLIASDELAQTRADAARAAVEAYRALGGGWVS